MQAFLSHTPCITAVTCFAKSSIQTFGGSEESGLPLGTPLNETGGGKQMSQMDFTMGGNTEGEKMGEDLPHRTQMSMGTTEAHGKFYGIPNDTGGRFIMMSHDAS